MADLNIVDSIVRMARNRKVADPVPQLASMQSRQGIIAHGFDKRGDDIIGSAKTVPEYEILVKELHADGGKLAATYLVTEDFICLAENAAANAAHAHTHVNPLERARTLVNTELIKVSQEEPRSHRDIAWHLVLRREGRRIFPREVPVGVHSPILATLYASKSEVYKAAQALTGLDYVTRLAEKQAEEAIMTGPIVGLVKMVLGHDFEMSDLKGLNFEERLKDLLGRLEKAKKDRGPHMHNHAGFGAGMTGIDMSHILRSAVGRGESPFGDPSFFEGLRKAGVDVHVVDLGSDTFGSPSPLDRFVFSGR